MTPFTAFDRLVRALHPKLAIVLGSGLDGVGEGFREAATIAFADTPGLFSTTVSGHPGSLSIGLWDEVPILLFRGRLHFYEGFSRDVVAAPIRIAADLGVKAIVLTNAAGAINPKLKPGSLVAIKEHIKIIGGIGWQDFVAQNEKRNSPYSPRVIELMRTQEAEAGRELPTGIYVALTGPSYETPAEIRALAACGADIVGMSTAQESETAAMLGLEVAALSCVTNAAAGLTAGLLNHAEVVDNAKLGVKRLETILRHLIRELG